MTTTHKDPRAVIEQLVGALEYVSQFLEDDNAAMLHVPAALTAGREALDEAKRESGEPLTPKGLTDAVMELADLLGNDPASAKLIDKCAWDHLLVYTHPQASEPAPQRPPNCGTGHCSCIECVMEPAPSTTPPCPYCDGTGDIHSITGEWRGSCPCGGQAPETEIPVSEPAPSTAGALIGCVQHDCADCKARAAQPAQGERAGVIERLQYVAKDSVNQSMRDLAGKAAALLQSTHDARPVGELTLAQITRIYDRYGGDMVNCTRAIERELAAARTQP